MNRAAALLVVVTACREQPGPPPTSRPPSRHVAVTYPPVLAKPVTASSLWANAAAHGTVEGWSNAAAALQGELVECQTDCLLLAHEVVLAREKAERAGGETAMSEHQDGQVRPLTRATLDAMDAYVKLAAPGDLDAKRMQLVSALTLDYADQLAAIPRLEAFIATYSDEDRSMVAEMLLDSLIRNGRVDDLQRRVAALLADPIGLSPELLARLARMQ